MRDTTLIQPKEPAPAPVSPTGTQAATYRSFKILLGQFAKPERDKNGKITKIVLPEKNINITTRRRHSVAVDQILRLSGADPADSDALLDKLIFVRCYLDPKNEAKRTLQEELLQVLFEKGFTLQKKDGTAQDYKLFLRSASMSRQGSLSFIAAELYDKTMEACTLGLHGSRTGWSEECRLLLSKYNAYAGLALSDADRIDALPCGTPAENKGAAELFLNERTVIVLPDPIVWEFDRKADIPLKEDTAKKKSQYPENGQAEAFRWMADFPHNGQYVAKTTKREGRNDLLTLEAHAAKTASPIASPFDGEGLISPRAAERIRQTAAGASGSCPEAVGTSFQVRLPFCKGMLHTVDFHEAMETFGNMEGAPGYTEKSGNGPERIWVTDIFGFRRDLRQAEIILTKSMFKAAAWLNVEANGDEANKAALAAQADSGGEKLSLFDVVEKRVRAPWGAVPAEFRLHDPMQMYFRRCAVYGHALYLCRSSSRARKESHDFLNYQILATLGFDGSAYRALLDPGLRDLAWLRQENREGDARRYRMLTHEDVLLKETVEGVPQQTTPEQSTGENCFRQVLQKDPKLLYSPMTRRLIGRMLDKRRQDTMLGRFRIEGMTRYLSSDLMAFLNALFVNAALTRARAEHPTAALALAAPANDTEPLAAFAARGVAAPADAERIFAFYEKHLRPAELPTDTADVPGISAKEREKLLLWGEGNDARRIVSVFRNPHMSANEQTLLFMQSSNLPQKVRGDAVQALRDRYLGGLDGICMLPSRSRTAVRLNGADFDGDIVRVITNSSYVGSLYKSLDRLWGEEQAEFLKEANENAQTAEEQLSAEELVLPSSRLPQLPLIQMDVKHDDVTTVSLSGNKTARTRLLAADLRMFIISMGNRIGQLSNQCVALNAKGSGAGGAELLEVQKKIRLYTTAVGCEIDAAKTSYTVDIEPSGVQPAREPFLRFNADIKRGRQDPTTYRYYSKAEQHTLDGASAEEGFGLLCETTGFLNILPWYAGRRLEENDACLLAESIPEKERPVFEGVCLTPAQIAEVERRKKYARAPVIRLQSGTGKEAETVPPETVNACVGLMEKAREERKDARKLWFPSLLWQTEAAEAEKMFAEPAPQDAKDADIQRNAAYLQWIRLLFCAYSQVRKSKNTVAYGVEEAMRRILFLNFPYDSTEELMRKVEILEETLRAHLLKDHAAEETEGLPAASEPVPEAAPERQRRLERLQAFCKEVTDYGFLLSDKQTYKNGLYQALCALGQTEDLAQDQNFLELCCAARRDGGYLLPYYAAQALQNEEAAPGAREMDALSDAAEKGLQTLLIEELCQLEARQKEAKKALQQKKTALAAAKTDRKPPKQNTADPQALLVDAFASLSTLCFETEEGDVRMSADSIYGQEKLRVLAKRVTEKFYPEKTEEEREKILFYAGLHLSDPRKAGNTNTYDFGCFFWDLCGPYAVEHLPDIERAQELARGSADESKKLSDRERWKAIRASFEKELLVSARQEGQQKKGGTER